MDLTAKEYALLEYLMRNSGRPLTKSLIIEHVWDIHFDSVRELASQVGVPSSADGLLVEDVSTASPAADAGVQPGDVIQEVNRQPVLTVDQLRSAMTRPSRSPMLLLVNRAGHELFLTARVS